MTFSFIYSVFNFVTYFWSLFFLELVFDQADDLADLPMDEDYYYDDYIYEVEAKPLRTPPTITAKPSPQSIKLNKQELLELYKDLSDVLGNRIRNTL